jgi:hypothetical protein
MFKKEKKNPKKSDESEKEVVFQGRRSRNIQ